MAYYYYYHQNHASSDSLSPGTIAAQSTPSPLLLLSPLPEQRQLTLPLLSPLIPSVTTSATMTTSAAIEYNQHQQQLPTPNTFIRHCEDMGLFHDLQNIVVMSSLTGPSDDTAFTTVPITTTSTMVTTSAGQPGTSNVFSSSSNGVLTTMMMANPFDETFKQAVLQQQKTDGNPTENILSKNNNDGELNTPFIVPTTVMEIPRNINNSSLPVPPSLNITTTAVVTAGSIESMTTTGPRLQQQNVFITTSAAEASARSMMLVMGGQQHDSIVTIQPHHQQNNHIFEQQIIVPSTTTTANTVDITTTSQDQDYYSNEGDQEKDTFLDVECGTKIKQTLKRNLLVKQLLHGRQKLPIISEKYQKHIQQKNSEINIIVTTATNQNDKCYEDKDQLQKQKQELLERNRSAAKRCRMKRKQKWDLLSEENRKLKIENSRLHYTILRLFKEKKEWSSKQFANSKETS